MAHRSHGDDKESVTLAYHDYRVKAKLRPGVAKRFDDGKATATDSESVYYAFVDAAAKDGYTYFPKHYHPGIFKRYPIQVVW